MKFSKGSYLHRSKQVIQLFRLCDGNLRLILYSVIRVQDHWEPEGRSLGASGVEVKASTKGVSRKRSYRLPRGQDCVLCVTANTGVPDTWSQCMGFQDSRFYCIQIFSAEAILGDIYAANLLLMVK